MLLAWLLVQDLCRWRAAQPVSSCWIPVGPVVSSEPALPLALTLLCPHCRCLFPASLNVHPLATFSENSPGEPPEQVCALTDWGHHQKRKAATLTKKCLVTYNIISLSFLRKIVLSLGPLLFTLARNLTGNDDRRKNRWSIRNKCGLQV